MERIAEQSSVHACVFRYLLLRLPRGRKTAEIANGYKVSSRNEGEFLPMDKMKKWLEKKPRGFGVGKKYETSIEDKLLGEIEQSWKAQAANLNKLKNDPLKSQLKRDNTQIKDPFVDLIEVAIHYIPITLNHSPDVTQSYMVSSSVNTNQATSLNPCGVLSKQGWKLDSILTRATCLLVSFSLSLLHPLKQLNLCLTTGWNCFVVEHPKECYETQTGFRVRVTNLPKKKKNVHRDLKAAFKEVSGVLNIAPAVSGNKKTKDPVCKGFALVDFKSEIDANRFVEQFTGQRLSFGKVIKQIKCQVVEFSSNQSVSEELYSDTVFKELPFPGLEAVSNVNAVEEDTFVDSWEESSDDSDKDVNLTEVEAEEEERSRISSSIESPKEPRRDSKTNARSQKQVVKRENREHKTLETPLVSFQAVNKSEEAVAETRLDDDEEHDGATVEDVAEENLETLNSSVSSSDEQRIDRIRRLELKLLGREKLLGGGADSDQPEAKTGSRAEGKKKEKKKKKKVLVKGKKSSNIEIPGSSKRLKVKEKALLTGVLVKYAAKAASTSNDE